VRGGLRASVPSFLLEGRERRAADTAVPSARFGFTVTKKLGNAVTRNRIRRRLKAAVAQVARSHANPNFDYVIVARAAAFDRPYASILADVERALVTAHRKLPASGRDTPKRETR
jgi:ribonuclease P protein component